MKISLWELCHRMQLSGEGCLQTAFGHDRQLENPQPLECCWQPKNWSSGRCAVMKQSTFISSGIWISITAGGGLPIPINYHIAKGLCILDDCSRVCCHIQWYLEETAECLIHGLSFQPYCFTPTPTLPRWEREVFCSSLQWGEGWGEGSKTQDYARSQYNRNEHTG